MTITMDCGTEVIESLDGSIREAFTLMIDQEIKQKSIGQIVPCAFESLAADPAVTVVVGLAGTLQGSVSIVLSKQAALAWTSGLLDLETDELDQTVIDAVGELGNIVVGGLKRRLTEGELKMTLPSVFRINKDSIVFPTGASPTQVNYDFNGDDITVLVTLQQAPPEKKDS